eukprot:581373-Amphidinium_carterae.1
MTEKPDVMHLVSWGSTKQKGVIAQSSCEAELLALKGPTVEADSLAWLWKKVRRGTQTAEFPGSLCQHCCSRPDESGITPKLQIKTQGARNSRNGETRTFVHSLCTYRQLADNMTKRGSSFERDFFKDDLDMLTVMKLTLIRMKAL